MRRTVALAMTMAVAVFGLISGCGTARANSSPLSGKQLPYSLKVMSKNPLHQPVPTVDVTLTNEHMVHQLWSDVLASHEKFPAGTYSCPNDTGLSYQLQFHIRHQANVNVVAQPTGCASMSYPGHSYQPTAKLLSDLRQSLHLDQSTFVGSAPASGKDTVGLHPMKIVVTKNGDSKTIQNKATMATIASAINQALQGGTNRISCQAMSTDSYTITLYYAGETRTFQNHGGSCQPLKDETTGKPVQSGNVLRVVNDVLG